MEAGLVSKRDLTALCLMCILEHKPDSNNLILFVKYIQEKREALRDVFQKNVTVIRKLNQLIEEARNQTFKQKLIQNLDESSEND